jgi:hypothetical protein
MEDVGPTSLGSSWSAPVDQPRWTPVRREINDCRGQPRVEEDVAGEVTVHKLRWLVHRPQQRQEPRQMLGVHEGIRGFLVPSHSIGDGP